MLIEKSYKELPVIQDEVNNLLNGIEEIKHLNPHCWNTEIYIDAGGNSYYRIEIVGLASAEYGDINISDILKEGLTFYNDLDIDYEVESIGA